MTIMSFPILISICSTTNKMTQFTLLEVEQINYVPCQCKQDKSTWNFHPTVV